jgi:hypothetical protein
MFRAKPLLNHINNPSVGRNWLHHRPFNFEELLKDRTGDAERTFSEDYVFVFPCRKTVYQGETSKQTGKPDGLGRAID